MARSPDPELHRWWRRLLETFNPDRWTVAEFCSRHDVSTASFYAWRRRLGDPQTGPSEAAAFLPIQIMQDTSDTERSVRVHLPGGVRIDVATRDRDLLFELIEHVTSGETSS